MKCVFQTFKSTEEKGEEREQGKKKQRAKEEVNLIQPYPHELHASN